jgi:hypothetical protein
MNKFFVTDEIYKERIKICKKCENYFSLTGQCKRCLCFMKIKARIGQMECPEKFWIKTEKLKAPEELPKELIEEVLNVWDDIKTGKAKNAKAKEKMMTLHNTIFNTKYSTGTNCTSCLNSCFESIKKVYDKYK